MDDFLKIVQIIPAGDGWRAVYAEDNSEGNFEAFSFPILGWALFDSGEVCALEAVGDSVQEVPTGLVSNCVGFIPPSEPLRREPEWDQEAQEILARRQRVLEQKRARKRAA